MSKKTLAAALFVIALGALAWGVKATFFTPPPPAPPQAEGNPMNSLKIIGPYDDTALDDMPPVVPMTDEQRAYVMAITDMTVSVIQKTNTLEQAEQALLGKGMYHQPKTAEPVTLKAFRSENFRMRFIGIVFERADEKSIWREADLRIHPKGSSKSAYRMDLPASFFEGMVLDKAYAETRKVGDKTYLEIHVFKFHRIKNGTKLLFQFETRPDMSRLSDKYPRSFNYLRVEREGG
jgi:hypothetical protein